MSDDEASSFSSIRPLIAASKPLSDKNLLSLGKTLPLLGKRGIRLRTVFDVRRLLARIINMTLKGEIESTTAARIGYLCGVMLKAFEQGELEQRIDKLEQAAKRKGGDT